MNIKKDANAILILSVLEKNDLYGYAIIKEIEKRSEGVFSFKEGTLYPILHSLEQNRYLKSYWVESEQGRSRKYYKITNKGLKQLNSSKEEWVEYSEAVNKVLALQKQII